MDSYSPIEPLTFPYVSSVLHGIQSSDFILPQIKTYGSYEYVTSSNNNPLTEDTSNVRYSHTGMYTRINSRGARFRTVGSNAIDMEVYVDSYNLTYTESSGGVYAADVTYPPTNQAFDLAYGDKSYYRSTTMYIFQKVEVPKFSDYIWDGRYTLVVDLEGKLVDSSDRRPGVWSTARAALESNKLVPNNVIGLGSGKKIEFLPASDSNYTAYDKELTDVLHTNYTSNAIPDVPTLTSSFQQGLPEDVVAKKITKLTKDEDSELILEEYFTSLDGKIQGIKKPGLSQVQMLAAVVDGDYFIKWTMATFDKSEFPEDYPNDSSDSN